MDLNTMRQEIHTTKNHALPCMPTQPCKHTRPITLDLVGIVIHCQSQNVGYLGTHARYLPLRKEFMNQVLSLSSQGAVPI